MIERQEGKTAGVVIFRLSGPFTARSMYECMPPAALENLLRIQSGPEEALSALNILDLTAVPYMDSMGLGTIVRHYVHCKGKRVQFVAAGASPRVMELFLSAHQGVVVRP